MDPNKALADFLDACREWRKMHGDDASKRADAVAALNVLQQWIRSGGYLPTDPRGGN